MENSAKITHTKVASRIGISSKQAPKIDQKTIAQAFGASAVVALGSLDVFSLRDAIKAMLFSKGGRPSLEGVDKQVKIPRIDEDWLKIEQIANGVSGLNHKPSTTQTAALILHMALANISEKDLAREMKKAFG